MSDEKLGATGEHPKGKLREDDEGALKLAVGVDPNTLNVIIDFGTPVAWLGMTPDDATDLAAVLIKQAGEARAMLVERGAAS